jgi:hypothetical protein
MGVKIMVKRIVEDGVVRDMTAKEIADIEAIETRCAELRLAEETAKAEHNALKASAKAKLIAGEALTEDEANTIVL